MATIKETQKIEPFKKTPPTKYDPNKRVTIKLFKDGGKYSEDMFVSVNDYAALIQRGKEVSVPYYVAKHIEEMQEQDQNTAMLITRMVEEGEKKALEHGM